MHGISHHLGEKNASTLTDDIHCGLVFDHKMTNPPLYLKKWCDNSLSPAARWADYGLPIKGNANYVWRLHILSKLKEGRGVAVFLLANGALDNRAIHHIYAKKTIENDMAWPSTVQLRAQSVAYEYLPMVRFCVKDERKKKVQLVEEQVQRTASIYFRWRS
jgi:hypothetical protein